MKKYLYLFLLLILATGLGACKKEYDDKTLGPLEDSVADTPITVPNQEFFERYPVVTASVAKAPSPFTIILQIPAEKGTIKEITKITTGATGLAVMQSVDTLAFNYNRATKRTVPIAGNGTNQITFTSNLQTYTAYRTRVGAANAGQPAVVAPTTAFTDQNPNQLPFYFLITLEDGRQLISTAVRVRVVK